MEGEAAVLRTKKRKDNSVKGGIRKDSAREGRVLRRRKRKGLQGRR